MPPAADVPTPPLTRAYRHGALVADGFPLAEVSDQLDQPGTMVWVDLCEPSLAQLHELAEELSLHELAVEDAVGPHQRPKVDHYDTHLFLACHAATFDPEAGELLSTEIDAFLGDRWLVTVRKDAGFDPRRVLQRWDRSPELAAQGVGFLLYGLLDVVVDGYFVALEGFNLYYDEVGDALFAERPLEPRHQRHWFEVRRALVSFHRLVTPMREVVSGLLRRDRGLVSDALYPYYQDVYDHILRVTESTDALRDIVGTLVEANISLRDYRQNQIVRKITGWAAIIAVPTLVTGFYGMNVPYPGAGEPWGVVSAVSLVVGPSAALYAVFRRHGWL